MCGSSGESDAESPPAPKRFRRRIACGPAAPTRLRTPKSAAQVQTRNSRQSAGRTGSAEGRVSPQSAPRQGAQGDGEAPLPPEGSADPEDVPACNVKEERVDADGGAADETTSTVSDFTDATRESVSTPLNAAVLPGLKVNMPWCETCESLASAPCFDDHRLLGLQRAVREAARDLGAKRDAMAGELLRAQEALQTLRTWTVAAEVRQDVAALRACAASLGGVQRALAHFVQTVRRPEAEARPAEPEGHAADEEAPLPPEDVPACHAKEERADDDSGAADETTSTVSDFTDATRESPEPQDGDAVPAAELKQEQENVDDGAARDQFDADVPRVYTDEECLDVAEESVQLNYAPALDFNNPRLDRVRWLSGVDCDERPDWCRALLQRVAPHVEWLYVYKVCGDHLEAIRNMPALLYLHVHILHVDSDFTPDLPLQLRELTVEGVKARHLTSVHRMPYLRKLSLDWCDKPIDVSSPPLPAHHRGLQWLWVALRPASTALSLAKAHAATLQELRLLCASEGRTPWHFVNLAADLRQCGLVALRRVVLLRGPAGPRKRLPHSEKSCKSQKQLVRAGLLALPLARPDPAVLCDVCDNPPIFPDLGDFTWTD